MSTRSVTVSSAELELLRAKAVAFDTAQALTDEAARRKAAAVLAHKMSDLVVGVMALTTEAEIGAQLALRKRQVLAELNSLIVAVERFGGDSL